MCFYFDLVSQIHYFLKKLLNKSKIIFFFFKIKKENNFSYNNGFWNWSGESHDFFLSHGGLLSIFFISSNHTVKGTFEVRPTCTLGLGGAYICMRILCGYFDTLYAYIYIYVWVETLKSTGLQLMTRSWVVC